MRPSERGRQVIVRRAADGETTDINPPDFNARTRTHEYGGGDYVVYDGAVYFSNYADQQLYRQKSGSAPERITNETSDDRLRYADAVVDGARDRLIAVREDHRQKDREGAKHDRVGSLHGNSEAVLVSGNDFYSSPRVSPNGSQLAWLT